MEAEGQAIILLSYNNLGLIEEICKLEEIKICKSFTYTDADSKGYYAPIDISTRANGNYDGLNPNWPSPLEKILMFIF